MEDTTKTNEIVSLNAQMAEDAGADVSRVERSGVAPRSTIGHLGLART